MAKRTSIELPGAPHKHPIPAACRVGNVLMSSVITGKDPERGGELPEGIEAQAEQMFRNMRSILERGGARPEDVIKVNVWMRDVNQRTVLNKFWLEMFPDAESRPARHTFPSPDPTAPFLVESEVVAVTGD